MADTTSGAAAPATGAADLPTWDLRDLYAAPDSPALAADLDRAEQAAKDFSPMHAGKLASLSGDELAAAIDTYEGMEEVLGRVMSYAQLLFAGDSNDPAIGRGLGMQSCGIAFSAEAPKCRNRISLWDFCTANRCLSPASSLQMNRAGFGPIFSSKKWPFNSNATSPTNKAFAPS